MAKLKFAEAPLPLSLVRQGINPTNPVKRFHTKQKRRRDFFHFFILNMHILSTSALFKSLNPPLLSHRLNAKRKLHESTWNNRFLYTFHISRNNSPIWKRETYDVGPITRHCIKAILWFLTKSFSLEIRNDTILLTFFFKINFLMINLSVDFRNSRVCASYGMI